MRFHVVALPHTQTNMNHSACAFTMKSFHFCQMMHSLGHEVFHYGVEGSQVRDCCVEDVTILSQVEQEGFFGKYMPDALYEVDWSGNAPYWKLLHDRAAAEINKRKQPGDFVCVMTGRLCEPLAAAVGTDVMVVEYGIGYNGPFAKYRVYESYAHMHKIWGAQGGLDPDGRLYDAVIPNYLNPDDYPFQAEKGNYYLYLGRLIRRKGIHIAVEACKRLGVKLKIAGQGCTKVEGNRIYCADGEVYEGDNLEYVGFATGAKRASLYQNAIATFVPTTYVEPFGAVAIESQMAGPPGRPALARLGRRDLMEPPDLPGLPGRPERARLGPLGRPALARLGRRGRPALARPGRRGPTGPPGRPERARPEPLGRPV